MGFVRVSTRLVACLLGVFLVSAPALGQAIRYDEHRVIEVDIATEADLVALQAMNLDFWSHHLGVGTIEVRVSPAELAEIEALGLPYRTTIADVQMLIDASQIMARGTSFFDDYHTYQEVNEFLDDPVGMDGLMQLYPTLTQEVDFGDSLEGRMMKGIRITAPGGGDKPEIFIHGGQHAREWITVPVVTYIAEYLCANYGTDPLVTKLVDRCEWYILPIMNPDGYVYTWTNQRLWRKNRRNNGGGDFGVDLNRNWSYQWGGIGSSGDPGNDLYRGPSPFSEPETQNMRDFFIAHPDIVAYIDYHSYGQLHLWAWGYTTASVPEPDASTLDLMGQQYVDIIESVHGEIYIPGPIGSTLYIADGASVDYAYGEHGVLGYTTELRPEGSISGGFILSADQIIPTCEEITPAMLWYADYASAPLRLTLVSKPADPLPPGTPGTVQVRVENNTGTLQPGTVMLNYREGNAGAFTAIPMTSIGGDLYEADLPPRDCGDPTEFYASADAASGETITVPYDAPAPLFELSIGELDGFIDDFESDTGWTTAVLGASSGAWQRGVPVNDPGWDYDPTSDGDGSGQAYLTQNVNGNTDVDGGSVQLTSPTVDLSDPNAEVSYAYFLRLTDPQSTDALVVQANNADGLGPWVQVVRHDTDGGLSWREHTITQTDLNNAGVAPSATMRFRFIANDDDPQSIVEAGVDAFNATTFSCTPVVGPCGDFDNDGDVDLADFGVFTQCFGGSFNPPAATCPVGVDADCDGDGDVDLGDFAVFTQNFTGSL